jgi:stage II sporulation protein M
MDLRRWLLVATALFGTGLVIGLLLPGAAANEVRKTFEDIAGGAVSTSGLGMCLFLFTNNALAVCVSFFLSPLFLILPVLSILMNGAVISLVSRLTLEDHSLGFLIAGLLPHGVIEIPAYLIAQAAALSFGFTLLRGLLKSNCSQPIWPALKASLRWLGLAVLLLIPAALLETFVTPVFIDLFE